MGLIRLFVSAPQLFLLLVVPLLYSVIAHEVAHGWCALGFGDETAKRQGRLTLNPLAHLSPIGTLMLLLVGFGWARPVPVQYAALRPKHLGLFCVALAGCAANLLIAVLAIFILQAHLVSTESVLATVLSVVARVNIALAAFNLIPLPQIDGSKLLLSVLPDGAQRRLAGLERYGLLLLLLLLLTGWLDPLITLMQRLIYGVLSLFFN